MSLFTYKSFFKFVSSVVICLNVSAFADDQQLVKIVMSDESPPTSYVVDGKPSGMYREILELLFSKLPKYRATFHAFPWKRAQIEVQLGQMDMFMTFPSDSRKEYALFTQDHLYIWDYGNLVYNVDNPKKDVIEKAKKFEDLKSLTFLSQEGVEWEKENVPSYIKRNFANGIVAMVHLLFLRNNGDFFIMGPEQATYYANKFGYRGHLRMKKVDFIPNSQVKFHVGVRKNFTGAADLINAIEKVMKDPDFLKNKASIEKKYVSAFNEDL